MKKVKTYVPAKICGVFGVLSTDACAEKSIVVSKNVLFVVAQYSFEMGGKPELSLSIQASLYDSNNPKTFAPTPRLLAFTLKEN